MSDWISREAKRKPKNGQLCLVCDEECSDPERVFIGNYIGAPYQEFYDRNGECLGSFKRHITHWMPAPISKGAEKGKEDGRDKTI